MVEKYVSIIWSIIKNPYEYFSREMPKNESAAKALIFAVTVSTVTFMTAFLTLAPSSFMGEFFDGYGFNAPLKITVAFTLLIFMPIYVTFITFFSALCVHGAVFMLVPQRRDFWQTFKVMAYCNATAPLMIIPIVGTLAFFAFNVRAFVFGISAVHKVSALKVFMFLIILPIMIITVLAVLTAVLFGAALSGIFLQYLTPNGFNF